MGNIESSAAIATISQIDQQKPCEEERNSESLAAISTTNQTDQQKPGEEEEEAPRLKYLIMVASSVYDRGIFLTSTYLSGELDERIVRKLEARATRVKPTDEYAFCQTDFWLLKITPTTALNRLSTEFGYKMLSTGSYRKSKDADSVYWMLEQVGTQQ